MIQSPLNDKLKQSEILLSTINANRLSNEIKVIEAMTFLRQIIDEHEKTMLQQIQNFETTEKKLIEEYKSRLDNQFKILDFQRGALAILLSTNDQLRLLQNKSEFVDYVNRITEILNKSQLPIGTDYHITGLELLQTLEQQIRQCAHLTQIIQFTTDEKSQLEELIVKYQTSEEVNLKGQHLTDHNIYIVVEIFKKSIVRTPSSFNR
jgi:hypothetical protein